MELETADVILLNRIATMAGGAIALAALTSAAPVAASVAGFAAAGAIAVGVTGVGVGITAQFAPKNTVGALAEAYNNAKDVVEAVHDPVATLAYAIAERFGAKPSQEQKQLIDLIRHEMQQSPTTEHKSVKTQTLEGLARSALRLKHATEKLQKNQESIPIGGTDLTVRVGDQSVDKADDASTETRPGLCQKQGKMHTADSFGDLIKEGRGAKDSNHPACSDSSSNASGESSGAGSESTGGGRR